MEPSQLNWIANFIWGIADDVLRDLYVRGKYRDVILPMTVLRRIDSLLEPTKPAVLDMKASLDKAGIVHQDQALRQEAFSVIARDPTLSLPGHILMRETLKERWQERLVLATIG